VLARLLIDVPAEFRGDLDLVANRSKRLAHHLLVRPGAVDFSGVEEIHAVFDSGAKQVDHLHSVGELAGLAIAHGAQRQSGDLQALAECALDHLLLLFSG
jgi:hypothetical protein